MPKPLSEMTVRDIFQQAHLAHGYNREDALKELNRRQAMLDAAEQLHRDIRELANLEESSIKFAVAYAAARGDDETQR